MSASTVEKGAGAILATVGTGISLGAGTGNTWVGIGGGAAVFGLLMVFTAVAEASCERLVSAGVRHAPNRTSGPGIPTSDL